MYEIASVSLADEGVYEAYIGGQREMGAITRLIVRSKSRGSFFKLLLSVLNVSHLVFISMISEVTFAYLIKSTV